MWDSSRISNLLCVTLKWLTVDPQCTRIPQRHRMDWIREGPLFNSSGMQDDISVHLRRNPRKAAIRSCRWRPTRANRIIWAPGPARKGTSAGWAGNQSLAWNNTQDINISWEEGQGTMSLNKSNGHYLGMDFFFCLPDFLLLKIAGLQKKWGGSQSLHHVKWSPTSPNTTCPHYPLI